MAVKNTNEVTVHCFSILFAQCLQVYQLGDQFELNPMDPCEVCECILSPDGTPSLYCLQVACPSLADCPRSCVKQPDPGNCYPTCTNRPECSYGECNVAIRGKQLSLLLAQSSIPVLSNGCLAVSIPFL